MSPIEVQALLGEPSAVEQATIPLGSVVGLQGGFAHKMAPGDAYLNWIFRKGDRKFLVFFAQVGNSNDWRLSWKVSYPAVVDD